MKKINVVILLAITFLSACNNDLVNNNKKIEENKTTFSNILPIEEPKKDIVIEEKKNTVPLSLPSIENNILPKAPTIDTSINKTITQDFSNTTIVTKPAPLPSINNNSNLITNTTTTTNISKTTSNTTSANLCKPYEETSSPEYDKFKAQEKLDYETKLKNKIPYLGEIKILVKIDGKLTTYSDSIISTIESKYLEEKNSFGRMGIRINEHFEEFESNAFIVGFKDSCGLEQFKRKYIIDAEDHAKTYSKLKINLKDFPIKNLHDRLKTLNKILVEEIKEIEFSSAVALKDFLFVSETYLNLKEGNNPDNIKDISLNGYSQPA